MIAVIKSGGKQYKVTEGQTVRVECLPQADGEAVEFRDVLLVENGDQVIVGNPVVENAVVRGVVEEHGQGKKVLVFKRKKRKQYKRFKGHRQLYTAVLIQEITC